MAVFAIIAAGSAARGQTISNAVSQAATAVAAASLSGEAAPQTDAAAARFMTRCAGCHSLSGVQLTGPELSHVTTWADDALKTSIKRMEKNVGPLADADIAELMSLLRDGKARERLKVEEARIQAQFMAKMEPPNAQIGKAVFLGAQSLLNGGLPCQSCHSAEGQGGNLGPDLTGVFAKMGQTPLVSTIEKSSFKVMGPHYQSHPVTKQEALHLAAYFSKLDPKAAPNSSAAYVPIGASAAACMLAGISWYFKSRRTGRDQRLQRRR